MSTAPHITANDGKIYLLPINPVWHSDKPPEPGWYPASMMQRLTRLRWYENGTYSEPARPFESEHAARHLASIKTSDSHISWTTPWWPPAEQLKIYQQAIAAGLAIPKGYQAPAMPAAPSQSAAPASPASQPSQQAQQIAAISAVQHLLPGGSRLFVCGSVISITLSGPDLKPGVPDAPPDADIQAMIGQLQALQRAAAKARAQANLKA